MTAVLPCITTMLLALSEMPPHKNRTVLVLLNCHRLRSHQLTQFNLLSPLLSVKSEIYTLWRQDLVDPRTTFSRMKVQLNRKRNLHIRWSYHCEHFDSCWMVSCFLNSSHNFYGGLLVRLSGPMLKSASPFLDLKGEQKIMQSHPCSRRFVEMFCITGKCFETD